MGGVASYDALVIANGNIYSDAELYIEPPPPKNTNLNEHLERLTAAIDWVHANAGKGEWEHVDASRIGVWGQSCGGLEAYNASLDDPRVGHMGILNSGLLSAKESRA